MLLAGLDSCSGNHGTLEDRTDGRGQRCRGGLDSVAVWDMVVSMLLVLLGWTGPGMHDKDVGYTAASAGRSDYVLIATRTSSCPSRLCICCSQVACASDLEH